MLEVGRQADALGPIQIAPGGRVLHPFGRASPIRLRHVGLALPVGEEGGEAGEALEAADQWDGGPVVADEGTGVGHRARCQPGSTCLCSPRIE